MPSQDQVLVELQGPEKYQLQTGSYCGHLAQVELDRQLGWNFLRLNRCPVRPGHFHGPSWHSIDTRLLGERP
jgi:hypothetical protein